MGAEANFRHDRRRLFSSLEGIGANVAAAVEGKSEIKPRPWRVVEFVRRNVVTHIVGAIIGKMKLSGGGMEVHADQVADAAGIDIRLAAGRVEADDGTLQTGDFADIAGRTDRHVKLAVGSESGVAPAMPRIVGQPVEENLRGCPGQRLQIGGQKTDDAVLLGDVEVSVPSNNAVGDMQAGLHLDHRLGTLVAVGIGGGKNGIAASADENHPQFRRHRHRPGPGDARVHADPKTRRQGDAVKSGSSGGMGRKRQTEANHQQDQDPLPGADGNGCVGDGHG